MLVRELRKLLSLQDQNAEVVLSIDTTDDPDVPYDEIVSFIDDCSALEADKDGRVVLPGWVGNDEEDGGDADDDEDQDDDAGDTHE